MEAGAWRRRRRHHPALRAPLLEGGECLGVVNVCGKTVHPSPATLASSEAVAAPPASRPDQRSEPPRAVGEQRPVTPADSLVSGAGTSWRAGEKRPLTPANSTGPETFPSSQEGWPKGGVVGPHGRQAAPHHPTPCPPAPCNKSALSRIYMV